MAMVDERIVDECGHRERQQHKRFSMPDEPLMIIEASSLNASFILHNFPEADQEAQQKRIRNDVLRPFDALVQFD